MSNGRLKIIIFLRLFCFKGECNVKKAFYLLLVQVIFTLLVGIFQFIVLGLDKWYVTAVLAVLLIIDIFIYQSIKKTSDSMSKEKKVLNKKLSNFNYEIQVASSQVSSVSEQLLLTIDESENFTSNLYSQAKEMSEHEKKVEQEMKDTTNVVNSAMELLENVNSTTLEAGEISEASDKTIKNSLGQIMDIVETIGLIKNSTGKTIDNMEKLNTTSKEIIGILETVNNISKQTHLLALNASIESARAGEAGKGFAVVAEEIRKLSMETEESVKNINSLITNIQSEVDEMYSIVNENAQNVMKGVEASKSVGSSLETINTSFEKVAGMINKINELSKEEAELNKNVQNKILNVGNIISVTTEMFEDVKKSIHTQKHSIMDMSGMGDRLKASAENLEKLIDSSSIQQFKVKNLDVIKHKINDFKRTSEEFLKNPGYEKLDNAVHKTLLDELVLRTDYIEAAWTNDTKGRFIYSNPPAGIANAGVRDWFKSSIKGEEFISKIYVSAITKNPCITYSMPVKNSEGKIIGVIGIDLKLEEGN